MFKRDLDLERKWNALLQEISGILGKKPKDLNAILFLICVHELGKGGFNAYRHLQSAKSCRLL